MYESNPYIYERKRCFVPVPVYEQAVDRIVCEQHQEHIACGTEQFGQHGWPNTGNPSIRPQSYLLEQLLLQLGCRTRWRLPFAADEINKRTMFQRMHGHKNSILWHIWNMHCEYDRKNPVTRPYRELRVRSMHRHAFRDTARIDKQRFADRLSRVRRIEPY